VGTGRALAMILLSETLSGTDALAAGLAVASVPRARVREHAVALATVIAERSPEAVRQAKALVRSSLDTPLAVGLENEFESLLSLIEAREQAKAAEAQAAPSR
jgi:enoyl-CoA hydratase